MPFPETIAREVRRRSHYQCCLCKSLGVEIHHIVPQADQGSDAIENAAPLCPSCHETYGANPTKRKFVREARDFWYELCARRYASDPSVLTAIQDSLETVASKQDIQQLRADLASIRIGFSSPPSNLSIPLSRSASGTKRWLEIRDLMVMVHATAEPRSAFQVNLLCLRDLWPVGRDDYRGVYKDFLRRFGERTLRHLAMRALHLTNVVSADSISDQDLAEALKLMRIEAVCMTLLDEGAIGAVLDDTGAVLWTGAKPRG